jgi:hypothetical protein
MKALLTLYRSRLELPPEIVNGCLAALAMLDILG